MWVKYFFKYRWMKWYWKILHSSKDEYVLNICKDESSRGTETKENSGILEIIWLRTLYLKFNAWVSWSGLMQNIINKFKQETHDLIV